MALLVGLFGGLGLVFLVEYLDNTVKGPEDVEKLVGLPSLGIIPYLSAEAGRKRSDVYGSYRSYGAEEAKAGDALPEVREIELINHLYPKFSIAEDYRTVRTSILFSHADSHAEDDRLHEHPAPGGQDGHDLQPGRLVRPARGQGPAHRRRPAQAAPEQDLQAPEHHRPEQLPRGQGHLRRGRPEDEHRQRLDDPQRPASAQPGRAAELEADEGAPGPGQGRGSASSCSTRRRSWPSSTRSSSARSPIRPSSSSGPGRRPGARSSGPSRRSASPRPTSSASSSTRSASAGRGSGRPSTTTTSTNTARPSLAGPTADPKARPGPKPTPAGAGSHEEKDLRVRARGPAAVEPAAGRFGRGVVRLRHRARGGASWPPPTSSRTRSRPSTPACRRS